MRVLIPANGTATVTLTASQKIAVFTTGSAKVSQVLSFANYPSAVSLLSTVTAGQYVSSAFTNGGTVIVENMGADPCWYEVGLAPMVMREYGGYQQGDPNALNATGTLTAAMILGGIVTSTSAAAVAATLDTGAIMDTSSSWAVGDSMAWSVINTGPNTVTVTASTGHTIVGAAAVTTATSGRFLTRKTAASTFITYRLC